MELHILILLSVWCGVVTERSDNEEYIYYTVYHRNDVFRVPASGGVAAPLNLSKKHCDGPDAIAFDVEHHCLYWTMYGGHEGIGRQCKGQTSSISLSGYKYGIAVDAAHDMLFTSDNTKDTIEIINYDLGTSKTVVRGNMSYPHGIVLDSQARWIFWADRDERYIAKARTNGTGRVPLVEEGIRYPRGVALGQNNSRLYFCGSKSVQSIGVDGSGLRTHLQDSGYSFHSIAVSRQFLYVRSHRPSHSILRLAIDAVNARGRDLQKITDIGTNSWGGIVLVESVLRETTATTTTDATTVATTAKATTVAATAEATTVTTTADISTIAVANSLLDIYKYSLLIAVPIMLVLLVTVSVCFCIKTGKCAKCRSSRINGQQDADVYYEDVSAIPMSHRPLPAIAQGESGSTSAQPCEDYLVPVPSASGARAAGGANAAQPCADYLVPVPEPPHTYMEL